MTQKVASQPQLQNLLNHRLLNDNVLLVPIEFESGDVVMQTRQYEDKPEWGLVLSIGDKVSGLTSGDVVLFMSYGGTKVKALGQDFVYVRSEDVISVHNHN